MEIKEYHQQVVCPTLDDFAKSYPQYAPYANADGKALFELITTPENFIKAAVATELGLAAVHGVAAACSQCVQEAQKKLNSYTKQYIGAVVCCLMEFNGYMKTRRKKAISHSGFTKGEMYAKMKKYTLVSLFSGAGGLDIGFENAGFKTIWANDIDVDACETHKLWSGATVVCGDIGKIDFSHIPVCDVIAGGFPCQGFSLAGPRKIDDARNVLYQHFVALVEAKKPMAFVAENVKGILTLDNGAIIEAIIADFANRGYDIYPTLVNAADYGIPQDRWRVIIMGFRSDLGINEFEFPKKIPYQVTLKDALRDIPAPAAGDICIAPFSSRYMSRNRKRNWDEVSFTIPAMSKQVALHPSSPDMNKIDTDEWVFGNGTTRRLSWQEAAAIQTFPKGMVFSGDLISKYKQIGNAVPVKLAEIVAKKLKYILDNHMKTEEA